jgi:lactoylglutathione lyase
MIMSLGHVAFRVADIEKSVAFYCEGLGCKESFRNQDPDGTLKGVYIRIARGQFIELFPGGSPSTLPSMSESSYRHVCLTVDDLQATVKELTARDVPLVTEVKRGVRDGNLQVFVADPDGNRVELMQIEPNSPQARAN